MVAKKKVVVALDKRAAGAARTATHVSGRGPVDASPIDRFMAEVRLFMLNSAGAMAEVRDRLESLEYGAGPGKHERSESFAKR